MDQIESGGPSFIHHSIPKTSASKPTWKQWKYYVKSYIFDWLFVVLFMVIFIIPFILIPPFNREFLLQDPSILYSYKNEMVPTWLLVVFAFVIPAVVIIITAIIRKSVHDAHHGLLALFLTIAVTLTITQIVKVTVGEHRPMFIAVCNPPALATVTATGVPIYYNSAVCQPSPLLSDAMQSFPSGHSSFSFAGLGFLSFYLAGKLVLFDKCGYTYKIIVSLLPLLGAMLIAISRVSDYRHHWWDVLAGGLLGFTIATIAYHQYYPSITSRTPRDPYRERFFFILPAELAAQWRNPLKGTLRGDDGLTNDQLNQMENGKLIPNSSNATEYNQQFVPKVQLPSHMQ